MAQGKKYLSALEKCGSVEVTHSLKNAVALIKSLETSKFDETMEIHVKTGCDPRHADQIVRSTIILPHGTGKSVIVAVFTDDDDKAADAKKAGADIIGADDLIAEVTKGNIKFDIALATPAYMRSLAKVARVLGPKGLMPSPKAGTVTPNIGKAVEELKKGKIEFKTDKTGIVHSIFGKKSFSAENLEENLSALINAMKEARPSGVKGTYIQKITITSTMAPAVTLNLSEVL
ncbi:TPA: 50S ribosomal protein L1 [Candidatus Peregrinibacteria bacterium]|nr:50S ribosomal protein L1 [Candidatus Peregrinibacteria bacterium]HIQ57539.1 50S ribosomal protein L1 [Candidatus Gracilibacteria bacterium]